MPERLAAAILSQYSDGVIPVDVEAIIRKTGAKIEWAGLSTNLIGMYIPGVYMPNGKAIIACSRGLDNRRARFTLAHELYHHVDYIRCPEKDKARFHIRDHRTERYANRFAGSLLMPEKLVRQLWRTGKSTLEMCDLFEVSRAALEVRLRELYLSQNISA